MQMTVRTLFVLTLAALPASMAAGQTTQPAGQGEQVTFPALLEAGDELLLTHTRTRRQSSHMGAIVVSTITDVPLAIDDTDVPPMAIDESTGQELLNFEASIRRIRNIQEMGGQRQVSDTADPNQIDPESRGIMTGLLAMRATGTISPAGEVADVDIQAEMMLAALREQLSQMRPEIQEQFTEERFNRQMKDQMRRYLSLPSAFLPDGPVRVGQSWTVERPYQPEQLQLNDPNQVFTMEIECTLANIRMVNGQRTAQIDLVGRDQAQAGVTTGPGAPQMQLRVDTSATGRVLFNLDAQELTGLTLEHDSTFELVDMPQQQLPPMKTILEITLVEDPGPQAPPATMPTDTPEDAQDVPAQP